VIFKRIFGTTIDLLFCFIPALIALSNAHLWEYYFILSFILYFIHTNIFLLINVKNTVGERIVKIYISTKYKNLLVISILKNLLFSVLIFAPLISAKNFGEMMFFLIVSLVILFPFNSKKNKEPTNGLDVLFKSSYSDY
jgi:hypothetical protein